MPVKPWSAGGQPSRHRQGGRCFCAGLWLGSLREKAGLLTDPPKKKCRSVSRSRRRGGTVQAKRCSSTGSR